MEHIHSFSKCADKEKCPEGFCCMCGVRSKDGISPVKRNPYSVLTEEESYELAVLGAMCTPE